MKANHNNIYRGKTPGNVGLNISNSKNESKSQPATVFCLFIICWVKYQ
ncbi:hypothetical protein GO621_09430 [Mucilaginibacter sp. HMF7410]|uniref:Uncharacterized protein n=1 Tax=Mucilaginibacter arboris TaxID=2682090 RepID=A0A7K1SWY9_9SPHI|nr:hypothetical protein [Mucilaginibacter arboris]MVN21757.1 hypothetical protein [Mucilaginibacter arboris]